MASIPSRYTPGFVENLDRRTALGKTIRARIETIETDLGGSDVLSYARRSLVRRAVWMEALIETSEQRLAAGEAIDLTSHARAVNSLLGIYRLLGLARRPRPAERLRDVMRAEVPVEQPA
jgi:hypothetical protein